MICNMSSEEIENLILRLIDVGALRFGEFTLKHKTKSDVFLEIKDALSPDLMRVIQELIYERFKEITPVTLLCGSPPKAEYVTVCISFANGIPMVLQPEDTKDEKSKKAITDRYKAGTNCMIIGDVVTSGSTILATAQILRDTGLVVSDAVVLLDQEQGGVQRLESQRITVHSLFTAGDARKTRERMMCTVPSDLRREQRPTLNERGDTGSNIERGDAAIHATPESDSVEELGCACNRTVANDDHVSNGRVTCQASAACNAIPIPEATDNRRIPEEMPFQFPGLQTGQIVVGDNAPVTYTNCYFMKNGCTIL